MISNDNWNQSSVKQYIQWRARHKYKFSIEIKPTVNLWGWMWASEAVFYISAWRIVDSGWQYLCSAVCAGASLVAAGWAGPRPDCAITTTNNTPPPPLYSSWDRGHRIICYGVGPDQLGIHSGLPLNVYLNCFFKKAIVERVLKWSNFITFKTKWFCEFLPHLEELNWTIKIIKA